MVAEKPAGTSSNNPLEQFVLLAKSAKGAACVELIKQVLEAPGVHVFGELLDMPNIAELQNGPNSIYFDTLNLFAYGTYKEYLASKDKLLELTPVQIKKLQHLTIVTLATKNKCIPYSLLLKELDIKNVRDLEDLIIEAIYADIIHGKLDQKNSQLEVDYAIGRDIRPADVGIIISTLQEWCDSCEAVLSCVETQIHRANAEKNRKNKHKEAIELEIQNIKKSLKTQQAQQQAAMDSDEAMAVDPPEIGFDKGKKPAKSKGRGSGRTKYT
ncbi:COP9 signalosome complex subunit 7b isoform X2 [Chrysoperla carnea]|uniref:COP9 signalosome complex subunit 7b isoform X2 n=1 Tax=Chrysoperla carnea TaxID=189513 RepID=UPI001D06E7BE|nr:COP9 signalosome complex subunit 7b isoform X2 [Chrysoperla carnea]